MTIFTTFALGNKEAYFMNTPTHWAWHNLPPAIESLFTATPPQTDILELALGDSGTYFISYRDVTTGTLSASHYNLPNPLTAWLYADKPSIVRDLATLSIALGQYGAYYAWDCEGASWANLPPGLEKAVLARLEGGGQDEKGGRTRWKANGAEAPCFVSLGADERYWMRTVSGGGCWDFKVDGKGGKEERDGTEGLKGMNGYLEGLSNFVGVASLHLFPSHPNAYILITTAGKAFSNLPECTWADYNKLAPALPTFVQSALPIPPTPQPKQQLQTPLQQAYQQPISRPPPSQQQYTTPSPYQYASPTPFAQPPFTQPYQQSHPLPQPPPPQQQQHNCCPPTGPGAPHNCCPQAPMQQGPYSLGPVYSAAPGQMQMQMQGQGQPGWYGGQRVGMRSGQGGGGFVYQ